MTSIKPDKTDKAGDFVTPDGGTQITPRRPRKGDSQFGPVCVCGAPKAKQAWTCQTCHSRVRGYGVASKQEIDRRARLRWLGQIPTVGDEDAALVAHAAALCAARASADGELAVLVAEQERDERTTTARDRWMLSLDGTDQFGRPLHEVIAA